MSFFSCVYKFIPFRCSNTGEWCSILRLRCRALVDGMESLERRRHPLSLVVHRILYTYITHKRLKMKTINYYVFRWFNKFTQQTFIVSVFLIYIHINFPFYHIAWHIGLLSYSSSSQLLHLLRSNFPESPNSTQFYHLPPITGRIWWSIFGCDGTDNDDDILLVSVFFSFTRRMLLKCTNGFYELLR